jgi:hypothetical protein
MEEYSNWLRASKANQPLGPTDAPVIEAEAALKAIREARNAEERRRAADALEKALKRIKKPESSPGARGY